MPNEEKAEVALREATGPEPFSGKAKSEKEAELQKSRRALGVHGFGCARAFSTAKEAKATARNAREAGALRVGSTV